MSDKRAVCGTVYRSEEIVANAGPLKGSAFSSSWCVLVERIGRTFVIGLFIVSGLSHVENPLHFVDTVYSYRIVPPSIGTLTAVLVPIIQLQVAYLLFVGVFNITAWIWATGLFGLFAIVHATILVRGLNVDCGCFGDAVHLEVGFRSFVILVGMLVLSVVCCLVVALGEKMPSSACTSVSADT